MKEGTHRWLLALPVLGFLALVPVFVFTDLDLRIQEHFFDPATQSWPHALQQPWVFLNFFGELPAALLGVAALSILLLGIGRPQFHRHRKPATFILCALFLLGLTVKWTIKIRRGIPPNTPPTSHNQTPPEKPSLPMTS